VVIDEMSYLPVNRDAAVPFFQWINARYVHALTVLRSNKGFGEWGQTLGDEVMAAALIDRLTHHCHVVNIRGISSATIPSLPTTAISAEEPLSKTYSKEMIDNHLPQSHMNQL
jgi:hypothetical protein